MSDVWERQFNGGQLFPTGFLAENDDDGDGQNNLKESYSGTNPLHFEPPEGHFVQNLRHIQAVWLNEPEEEPILVTPAAFEVDWQSVVGKVYQLKSSQNLEPESWTAACAPVIGDGQTITFATLPTLIGGQPADKLFWRVAVTDIDGDSDGLFDYEEHVLGLNPDNPQTFPGIDDLWLATHYPDEPNSFEPDDDADGDGLTNRQEHLYGTNPNIVDIIGPVNLTLGGEDDKHLVVSAPNTQVPHLRYKTFFYNACDTGMYFIENFEHATFVNTKSFCKVEASTQIFVQGLLEAKTMDEIMTFLNDPDVHGRGNQIIYAYEDDF